MIHNVLKNKHLANGPTMGEEELHLERRKKSPWQGEEPDTMMGEESSTLSEELSEWW